MTCEIAISLYFCIGLGHYYLGASEAVAQSESLGASPSCLWQTSLLWFLSGCEGKNGQIMDHM